MSTLTTQAAGQVPLRMLSRRPVTRLLSPRATFLAALLVASPALASPLVQRGSPIPSDGRIVPLASVISNPKEFTREEIITEGTVRKVCLFAGCWMRIAADD